MFNEMMKKISFEVFSTIFYIFFFFFSLGNHRTESIERNNKIVDTDSFREARNLRITFMESCSPRKRELSLQELRRSDRYRARSRARKDCKLYCFVDPADIKKKRTRFIRVSSDVVCKRPTTIKRGWPDVIRSGEQS